MGQLQVAAVPLARVARTKALILGYASVCPFGILNALKLWLGYVLAGFCMLVFPKRRRGVARVGEFIPGYDLLKVKVRGLVWLVRPRSCDLGIVLGTHEPEPLSWFEPEVGEVVIDVGAHIGAYTMRAALRGCRVVAVEPESASFCILLHNIALNRVSQSVLALQEAISNRIGKARLSVARSQNTGSSSLQRRVSEHFQEVNVESLDSLISRADIVAVDWLKIDVEGDELNVLSGAETTLSKTRKIIVEVTPESESDVEHVLASKGFKLTRKDRPLKPAYLFLERLA